MQEVAHIREKTAPPKMIYVLFSKSGKIIGTFGAWQRARAAAIRWNRKDKLSSPHVVQGYVRFDRA